tara:strand:- start:1911 stop:2948 length:1038 start_codon:yes stop_codon:yes gene_type:complete
MLKNILKSAILRLGYEIKKVSVKSISSKLTKPSSKVNVTEYTEKNLNRTSGISLDSNLLLTPKFNDSSFSDMVNAKKIWGFTKCRTGEHEFYMALLGNDDGVALRFYNTGYYEKFTTALWTKFSSRSRTILDIGAHTGSYSISARIANPSSKVISFEPHYLNFARLALNLRANGYDPYDIYMIAASDSNQNVYFQVPRGDAYHSSGGSVSNVGSNITNDGYWVNAVSIDDFLQGHTKNTVDLIKIDVEGYELNVLKGMSQMISEMKPTIFFECITKSNHELEEFFKNNRYKIYCIDDHSGDIEEVKSISPVYTQKDKLDMNKLNRIAIDSSQSAHYEIIQSLLGE